MIVRPKPSGRVAIERLERRALLTVAGGGFTEAIVGPGLREPTAMAVGANADDPVLVAERLGRVRVYRDAGGLVREPALTLAVDSAGGRGLLGVAVGRTFTRDRYVYLAYAARDPFPHLRVSRFQLSGNEINPKSEAVLLDLPAWDGATTGDGLTNLGGGLRVAFDGTLLVGVGDQGKRENAAAVDNPWGKVLRIKPTGGAPADNPFAAQGGWAAYVWASGFRDPAKLAVQAQDGAVFVTDPGEARFQEVDRAVAGADYGWPAGEGPEAGTAPAHAYPTASADPAAPARSHVSGGVFFTAGTLSFPVPFARDYFFADRGAGTIRVIDYDRFRVGDVEVFATGLAAPVDLAAAGGGDLFCVVAGTADADGQLIRYRPNGAPAIVRHPRGGTVGVGGTFGLSVEAAGRGDLAYQWQRNGADVPGAVGATYMAGPFAAADDGATFRVIVTSEFGTAYSREAVVRVTAAGPGTGGTDPGTGTGGTPGTGTGGGGGRPGSGNPFPAKPPKPQGPFDLAPTITSAVPGAAVGGSRGRATVRVANYGLDVSPGPMTVQLFLSADDVVDPLDARVAELTKTVRIKPGGGKAVKLKFTYPADGLDGTYRLIAQVDPVDPTFETNRLNNQAAGGGAVQVAAPFVDVRALVGPAAASTSAGGQVVVPVTVYNDGNLSSGGEVTVVVSVVPGGELAGTTGPAAAEAVATGTAVYTVTARVKFAPRRGKTLKLRFALPADLAAGTYTLAASADTANVVAEADETNNTAVGPAAFAVV